MKIDYFPLIVMLTLLAAIHQAFAFSKKPSAPPAPALVKITNTATSFSTMTSIGTWGEISPTPAPTVACATVALEKSCPAAGSSVAVDVSEPTNQKFLCAMRQLGLKRIIRYGDYTGQVVNGVKLYETLSGKVPSAAELKMINDNGFGVEAVFQHNNRWDDGHGHLYNTFNALRGAADAERMHDLYPNLPRWFYGVDFDATPAQMVKVKEYATAFKKVADKYGKVIGAYGSGYALNSLFDAGLIKLKWIAQSSGFDGTKALTASGNYDLLQSLEKACGGIRADYDAVGKHAVGVW